MKHESITKESLMQIGEGDIVPMFNNWDYLDGRLVAMVEKREGDRVLFLTRVQEGGSYFHIEVKNIEKGRVVEGRYHVCLDPNDIEEGILTKGVRKDYSLIGKFEKELMGASA